jgi:phosphoenolpyruvate-protein kinase (PTS system EI component)
MNNIENELCHFCNADLNGIRKQNRRLPVMIDGELVVIQNDGQAEDLKKYSENLKQKQAENVEEKKRQEEELISISDNQKVNIIKDNLFTNKRKIKEKTASNPLWGTKYSYDGFNQ